MGDVGDYWREAKEDSKWAQKRREQREQKRAATPPSVDDDDLGETFRAMREDSKERRSLNRYSSVNILDGHGVEYKKFTEDHLRVGEFDFWPATGLFIHIKTKARGRGVFNLMKKVKNENV